jgi:predicted nucleotidyltransferase
MIELKEHTELFKLVGERLKSPVECIAIGGSAMLFYGLKTATKDVDIVFFSQIDMDSFIKILAESGFSRRIIGDGKPKKGIPIVMERGDARHDLFLESVFHFIISSDMRERVEEKHEFDNLTVGIISHEDIILLKSVTDREGDRTDVKNIIGKLDVNWDLIINEALWQSEHGDKAFSVYLFDFLEELSDSGVRIPKEVLRKVRKISEDEMLKILKSGKGNVTSKG